VTDEDARSDHEETESDTDDFTQAHDEDSPPVETHYVENVLEELGQVHTRGSRRTGSGMQGSCRTGSGTRGSLRIGSGM